MCEVYFGIKRVYVFVCKWLLVCIGVCVGVDPMQIDLSQFVTY